MGNQLLGRIDLGAIQNSILINLSMLIEKLLVKTFVHQVESFFSFLSEVLLDISPVFRKNIV